MTGLLYGEHPPPCEQIERRAPESCARFLLFRGATMKRTMLLMLAAVVHLLVVMIHGTMMSVIAGTVIAVFVHP